ncbi:MAG: Arm DNA-binding domain-containing protein [Chitinophagaceae bacterium]
MSILFYVKKTSRNESDKLLSIYLRVTINGNRFEISEQRYIEQGKWSNKAGKARGNSEEARSVNMHLDTLKQRVYHYQQSALSEGEVFTKELLRRKWYGLDERTHKLMEIFKQHNDQLKALVGREVTKETLGKFNTTVDHTVNFMQWKYHSSDIDIAKLDYAFLTDF